MKGNDSALWNEREHTRIKIEYSTKEEGTMGVNQNEDKKYNIFISYRGNNEKCVNFARRLYQEMVDTPRYQEIFGEPFFSPANAFGNFREDIDKIMQNVKYFILPYYKGFFDDFMTVDGRGNENSITRLEIESAIRKGCPYFVPVYLENEGMDAQDIDMVRKLFKEKATMVNCANQKFWLTNDGEEALTEVIDSICEALAEKEMRIENFGEQIQQKANVVLGFKEDTEDPSEYSRYQKFFGCKKITLVNLAGTSFISGSLAADVYKSSDWMKRWYIKNLKEGKIASDVVILEPGSSAAKDAEEYKMYPMGLNIEKGEIISRNLEQLLAFKMAYPKAAVKAFLTKIALSNAIMKIEYKERKNNYMKLDLYAPLLSNDRKRPSFYLFKKDRDTELLYDFFDESIDKMLVEAGELIRKLPNEWIWQQNFAHRAVLSETTTQHTESAFRECMKENVSMEVDLLFLTPENGELKEDDIIVGRDEDVTIGAVRKKLSECSRAEFEEVQEQAKKEKNIAHGELCTLRKLLEINFEKMKEPSGEMIPMLVEFKWSLKEKPGDVESIGKDKLERYDVDKEDMKKKVDMVLKMLWEYPVKAAIHSSNPFIVDYAKEKVKEEGKKTLCGQITLDMEQYDTSEVIKEIYRDGTCLAISQPDFVSCKVDDINKLQIATYCYRNHKPLLGWGVTKNNREMSKICDALILDNYKSEDWVDLPNGTMDALQ